MRNELFFRQTVHIRGCVLSCKIVHVHSVFQQRGTLVNLFSVDCKNDTDVCTIFCNIDLLNLVRCIVFAYLYLSILQLQLMQHDTELVPVVSVSVSKYVCHHQQMVFRFYISSCSVQPLCCLCRKCLLLLFHVMEGATKTYAWILGGWAVS